MANLCHLDLLLSGKKNTILLVRYIRVPMVFPINLIKD